MEIVDKFGVGFLTARPVRRNTPTPTKVAIQGKSLIALSHLEGEGAKSFAPSFCLPESGGGTRLESTAGFVAAEILHAIAEQVLFRKLLHKNDSRWHEDCSLP